MPPERESLPPWGRILSTPDIRLSSQLWAPGSSLRAVICPPNLYLLGRGHRKAPTWGGSLEGKNTPNKGSATFYRKGKKFGKKTLSRKKNDSPMALTWPPLTRLTRRAVIFPTKKPPGKMVLVTLPWYEAQSLPGGKKPPSKVNLIRIKPY